MALLVSSIPRSSKAKGYLKFLMRKMILSNTIEKGKRGEAWLIIRS